MGAKQARQGNNTGNLRASDISPMLFSCYEDLVSFIEGKTTTIFYMRQRRVTYY